MPASRARLRVAKSEAKHSSGKTNGPQASPAERDDAARRTAPRGVVVYQAILHEGEDDLRRKPAPLAFSGLAAGLSMGFSLVAEGLLHAYLPDAPWRPLVSKLGYSVGFLIVILGRQQLFTENTLTVILPLLIHRNRKTLAQVLRLWAVVLGANLIGVALFASVAASTTAFEPEAHTAFTALGEEALARPAGTVLLRAIFAGWLIALMVWLLPYAETARIWVIIILAYVIGLGHFAHIIAGSVKVLYLVFVGGTGILSVITAYLVPTLVGNVIGGVTLVAVLAHVQFMVQQARQAAEDE